MDCTTIKKAYLQFTIFEFEINFLFGLYHYQMGFLTTYNFWGWKFIVWTVPLSKGFSYNLRFLRLKSVFCLDCTTIEGASLQLKIFDFETNFLFGLHHYRRDFLTTYDFWRWNNFLVWIVPLSKGLIYNLRFLRLKSIFCLDCITIKGAYLQLTIFEVEINFLFGLHHYRRGFLTN